MIALYAVTVMHGTKIRLVEDSATTLFANSLNDGLLGVAAGIQTRPHMIVASDMFTTEQLAETSCTDEMKSLEDWEGHTLEITAEMAIGIIR
jgi:hypothetical protein